MILYTPLQIEEVLQGIEKTPNQRECVTYQGKMFYVDKLNNGDHQLVQLLSTNPNDYMNQQYTPGKIL